MIGMRSETRFISGTALRADSNQSPFFRLYLVILYLVVYGPIVLYVCPIVYVLEVQVRIILSYTVAKENPVFLLHTYPPTTRTS